MSCCSDQVQVTCLIVTAMTTVAPLVERHDTVTVNTGGTPELMVPEVSAASECLVVELERKHTNFANIHRATHSLTQNTKINELKLWRKDLFKFKIKCGKQKPL